MYLKINDTVIQKNQMGMWKKNSKQYYNIKLLIEFKRKMKGICVHNIYTFAFLHKNENTKKNGINM